MAVPPKGTQQALKDQFKRTAGAFWADTSVVIERADSWKFHAEFDTVEKCGSFAKRIAQIMGKPLRQWLRQTLLTLSDEKPAVLGATITDNESSNNFRLLGIEAYPSE